MFTSTAQALQPTIENAWARLMQKDGNHHEMRTNHTQENDTQDSDTQDSDTQDSDTPDSDTPDNAISQIESYQYLLIEQAVWSAMFGQYHQTSQRCQQIIEDMQSLPIDSQTRQEIQCNAYMEWG